MVFEKKQLSKALAIALMVACAVAFMPLLNGQAFAAAKKPAKVKSLKAAQVADTMTAKATWKKGKNCKKYNVKVDGVLVAKKQKAKSYTTEALTEGAHKIAVAGVNGKKVGKYKTVTVNIVAPTPPVTKFEVTGVVQSGAKQLKVTFSQAVTDPSTLKFVVKRAGKEIAATAKADPNDPNSVLLDLDTVILKDTDYDVAVFAGDGIAVPVAAGVSTDVKGAASEVTAIEVDENLILNSDTTPSGGGYAYYKIKNQFGEDVTSTITSGLTVTNTFGGTATASPANGVISLDKINPALAYIGAKGNLIVVYTGNGVNTNQAVTVSAASKISNISIKGVYDQKTKAPTTIVEGAADGNKNAVIAFTAEDQYGHVQTATDSTVNATLAGGLTQLTVGTINGTLDIDDETSYQILTIGNLPGAQAGEATVVMVSNETGARDTYAFEVGDANVIASMTVTAPEQVIGGGYENEFVVEAKNAAGEDITKYSLLRDQIQATSPAGAFSWVKNIDGTGTLVFTENAAESGAYQSNTADYLTSATFVATRSYQTQFTTFTVLGGYEIPAEVDSATWKSVETWDGGWTVHPEQAYLSGAKIVDKFGNKCTLSGNDFYVKATLTNDANGKLKLKYDGTTKTSKYFYMSLGTLNNAINHRYVVIDGSDLVEASATGTVEFELFRAPKAGETPVTVAATDFVGDVPTTETVSLFGLLASTLTSKVSVAKDIEQYDSYVIKVVGAANFNTDVEDIDTIYAGEYADDEWTEPLQRKFNVSVYGMNAGSSTEYLIPRANYRLKSTIDGYLANGGNYNYTYTIDRKPAKDGLAGDTISLLLPGTGDEVIATKALAFSQEEPVATTLAANADGKYEYAFYQSMSQGTVDAKEIERSLAKSESVYDQYSIRYPISNNSATPGITAVNLAAIQDKDGNPCENYTVSYNNTTDFSVVPEKATDEGTVYLEGDNPHVLNATITIGSITQAVKITDVYFNVPLP